MNNIISIIFWISLIIIFYTYLGYGMLIFLLVKIKELFKKPVRKSLPENLPEVSLIIAAYNEEDFVRIKMENSLALDYPKEKFHIIWVTDGTTDSTNELLAAYPEAEVYFSPERKGKTAAINRIMPFVKSPIVIFTDANTMLNSKAVKNIVTEFTDPKVGCVAGEKRVSNEPPVPGEDGCVATGEGLYWRYESFLKTYDYRLYTDVGAAGELFAVRRDLFRQQPEDTLLDDFMISMEVAADGYRIAYCPNAYASESGSANFKEESKRKVRISAGGLQSIWRLRYLLNPFKYGILWFQYVSHRVLRWTLTPVLLLLIIPLNIYLCIACPDNLAYKILLAGQALFYLGAWLGYVTTKKDNPSRFLFLYYFLFMNFNVFRGIFYLMRKREGGAWEKARRARKL